MRSVALSQVVVNTPASVRPSWKTPKPSSSGTIRPSVKSAVAEPVQPRAQRHSAPAVPTLPSARSKDTTREPENTPAWPIAPKSCRPRSDWLQTLLAPTKGTLGRKKRYCRRWLPVAGVLSTPRPLSTRQPPSSGRLRCQSVALPTQSASPLRSSLRRKSRASSEKLPQSSDSQSPPKPTPVSSRRSSPRSTWLVTSSTRQLRGRPLASNSSPSSGGSGASLSGSMMRSW